VTHWQPVGVSRAAKESVECKTTMSREGNAMKRTWIVLGLCLAVATAGCEGGRAEIKDDKTKGDRLTVGKVQGEIKVGMPASQVAELLGSPNIVTTDDKRREVWIYDKVSTDRVDEATSSYATLIIVGARSDESSSSQRQRTLTIIIKYDEEKKVRDFAYNYTQF
jgi:outer membrane protein assembly factor BamE (lipoprotein component of BamABCDE complex)